MAKKIICLIDTLGSGGAERQIVGLAILLKEKGYNVDLLSYHSDNFYEEMAHRGGVEPILLENVHTPLSKIIAVRKHIKRTGGCDWLIAYKGGPNTIGCLLRMTGMRFRLIVSERTSNRCRQLSWRERLRYQLYRFATIVSPNSVTEGEYIKETYPWLKDKTIPITNYSDIDYFVPKHLEEHQCVKVLTVARVSRTKNILNYIKAVDKVKKAGINNVHFEWYGRVEKGHEDFAQECYSKLVDYGLTEVFSFFPATNDIIQQYQDCDIFCLQSIYEGYPNVICEAMSCGKPIACSRVCDNPLIVSEGENGLLFDPNNVDDMANKLLQMVTMPHEKLEQWGRCSRTIAEKLFSKESFVGKYIKLIESTE